MRTDADEVRSRIRKFITELLASKGDSTPFTDQEYLLLSGRLQSIDALHIVLFLEESFGRDFSNGISNMQEVESVDTICDLIRRTTGSNKSSGKHS